ncbi:uncharacterized protein IWZ02DRAFT_494485 [Phyllosticta citriasiana]|uniref:uncharacterized protein n=1 Tax=Phyllosticta citriasiana TaxID=595635 RepID=UPI0030FDD59C
MGEELGFPRDGEFRALLQAAQAEFLESTHIPKNVKRDAAEFESDPESWLKAFQNSRRKGGRFDTACTKITSHFKQIQTAISALGFAVNVISAPIPAAAPASLAVTAVSYLFVSIAKISDDFNRVEAFFYRLAKTFRLLSPLDGDIEELKGNADPLKGCIIDLFKSWFEICSIGISQTKHRHLKFWKKLFNEDEFDEALSKSAQAETDLERSIDALNLALSAKTYLEVKKMADKNEEDERDDILDWLSELNFNQEHQRLQERVYDSRVAGRWLLKSDAFTRWRDGDSHRLWYTGNPGAGKSVLASIVTEHLQEWVQRSENAPKRAAVACLYLSYKENPKLTELLGSILRQFESKSTFIDSDVRSLFKEYRQHGHSFRPLQLKDIERLLSQMAKSRQMYIVVDAMDECERDVRYALMGSLQSIGEGVKILVTSRVLAQQVDLQHGFIEQEIEAHDDDMQDYIDQVIQKHGMLQEFSKVIKDQVPQRSGKMFLIAQLHMNALTEVEAPNDVKRVLKTLPDSISGSYDDTITRIRQKLQHALASREVTTEIQEGDLIPESDIASHGHGLIVIGADKRVHFLHYSTQEYLDKNKTKLFPDFENHIVISCAQYLCRAELEQQAVDIEDLIEEGLSFNNRLYCFPFAQYSGNELHVHCHNIRNHCRDPQVSKAINTLLQRKPSRALYDELHDFGDYYKFSTALDPEELDASRKSMPVLHLAVFLGFVEPVKELVGRGLDVNERDWIDQTAFTLALKHGFDDVACVLLDFGAAVDLPLDKGYRILRYALAKNCTQAVQKIVECYPNPERDPFLKRYRELIPLAYNGNVDGLRSLIDPHSTKRIDLRPIKRRNPRHKKVANGTQASGQGQSDAFEESDFPESDDSSDDSSDNSSDDSGNDTEDDTSIKSSDKRDKEDNAQSQENMKKFDVRMSSHFKRVQTVTLKMACFLAVEQGHLGVVKLFLDHGVNPNLKLVDGQSLLHCATAKSNYQFAELLLNYDAKIDTRDWIGRTPLTANVRIAVNEVLNLLKCRGANVNLFEGGTTQLIDQEESQWPSISTLADSKSVIYATALFVAAVDGAVEVVRFLLDNGADASSKSSIGWTPLHGAASQGLVECARLLLERGADVFSTTDQGDTPLDLAVSGPEYFFLWGVHGDRDGIEVRNLYTELSAEDTQRQRKETVELLKKYGAKSGAFSNNGQVQRQLWHDDFWAEYERREDVWGPNSRILSASQRPIIYQRR